MTQRGYTNVPGFPVAEAAEQTAAMLTRMRTMSLMLVDILEKLSSLASRSASMTLAAISHVKGVLQHVPIAKGLMERKPISAVEDVGRRLMETGEKTQSLAQNIRASLTQPTKESLQASIEGLAELQKFVSAAFGATAAG